MPLRKKFSSFEKRCALTALKLSEDPAVCNGERTEKASRHRTLAADEGVNTDLRGGTCGATARMAGRAAGLYNHEQ